MTNFIYENIWLKIIKYPIFVIILHLKYHPSQIKRLSWVGKLKHSKQVLTFRCCSCLKFWIFCCNWKTSQIKYKKHKKIQQKWKNQHNYSRKLSVFVNILNALFQQECYLNACRRDSDECDRFRAVWNSNDFWKQRHVV